MAHHEYKKMKCVLILRSPSCFCFFWALIVLVCLSSLLPSTLIATEEDLAPGRKMAKQVVKEEKLWITSDHKQHEALKQSFRSGPEVTKACLSCHNQAALQFHKTIHWTWMDPITEKSARLGKGGLSINNF